MNDPDIVDYLELDMDKVWAAIADVTGTVIGPNGEPIGRERDSYGISEKSFLDIGIVRFPDIDTPHVKVCSSHTPLACFSTDGFEGFPPQAYRLEPDLEDSETDSAKRDQRR